MKDVFSACKIGEFNISCFFNPLNETPALSSFIFIEPHHLIE